MTYPDSPGKPGLGSAHGVEGGGKLDIAAEVERHAECIVSAMGFYLWAYDEAQRRPLMAAVLNCYEEAYRAGAQFATATIARSLPAGGDND